MKTVAVTLPDGSVRQIDAGTTAQGIAAGIGKRLEEAAVAAKIDGKVVDLRTPIQTNCSLSIITRDSKEGLEVIRHSTAHLLAHAVKELFPETQVTIGPVTEEGFYYDFQRPTQFTPEDLVTIEKRMNEIAAQKLDVQRAEGVKSDFIPLFEKMNEKFKVEIIESIPDSTISVYSQGKFIDLCRGPHVPNTAKLGKFKLLSIAGAYWRGDEKNPMLQRIYGTAFATQKELDEYVTRIEEARKNDHRKLGPELGLFTFLPIAPAMPFFLPKGTQILTLLIDFIRKEIGTKNYHEVICPQLMTTDLWKLSGHIDHFRENMFVVELGEEKAMALKPMNCPGHAALFGSQKHSYRELPYRLAEFSRLHRYERAGVTHGLMRTRSFSQDDGHIFCTEDQIHAESLSLIQQIRRVYQKFGFTELKTRLATRPDSFAGTEANWDRATKSLEKSLLDAGEKFEWAPKEGAFYGPKIEFHTRDSLGRFWQCGTVQVDFNTPEKFQLEYIDRDNTARRPVMIHRAIFGSFERFLGILVEHYRGHFPLWLSPTQVTVINVSAEQEEYAKKVEAQLMAWGIRTEIDLRNEKLGYKVREAQLKRIPLMAILGAKELEENKISIRKVSGENVNGLTYDAFQKFFEEQLNSGGTNH